MEFKSGKLYKLSGWRFMIYPTPPAAKKASMTMTAWSSSTAWTASGAVANTKYWSDILNCTVRCSEPDEIFIFLEEETIMEQRCLNILFGDKQGWIVYEGCLNIEKVL